MFLRVSGRFETTATFKHKKQDLVRQGFDPCAVADPLYVFDRVKGAYVALDRERYADIESGAMRL